MELQLSEEKILSFYLQEKLAPEVHRENGGTATEDTNKGVLECLDGFFGYVLTMVVRGNKFVCHIGVARWPSYMLLMLGCPGLGVLG
jgi:hypothetical protein